MIFWQATMPTVRLESGNPLVVIYTDKSNSMTESQVRLTLYREMFMNDMFVKPEIILRKMGKYEIISIPLSILEEQLSNSKESFAPFEIFVSEADIRC